MIKKSKSISINVLSVFIILTCLLLGLVTPTNAWFTDGHQNGIYINVQVSNLNFKLYQHIDSKDVEIHTYEKNTEYESDGKDDTKTQFVELSGKISPEENVVLQLKLKNEDKGETTVYVRFRLQLMARGLAQDTEIPIILQNFTAPTVSTPGFVKGDALKGEDANYYYYKESSLATAGYALFAQNTEAYIMQSFNVPYSSFFDDNGNMKIKNSETVYIKLVIEEYASSDNFVTGG